MPFGLSGHFFWASIIGAGGAALALLSPVFAQRRQRRLKAILNGAPERYFEERRELEAYTSEETERFSKRTILSALALGGFLFAWIEWGMQVPDHFMPAIGLVFAAMGFVSAALQARRQWRDTEPDPRSMILSPAPGDKVARAERLKRIGSILPSLAMALFGLMVALPGLPVLIEWLRSLP